jgi:hypothetical protein
LGISSSKKSDLIRKKLKHDLLHLGDYQVTKVSSQQSYRITDVNTKKTRDAHSSMLTPVDPKLAEALSRGEGGIYYTDSSSTTGPAPYLSKAFISFPAKGVNNLRFQFNDHDVVSFCHVLSKREERRREEEKMMFCLRAIISLFFFGYYYIHNPFIVCLYAKA